MLNCRLKFVWNSCFFLKIIYVFVLFFLIFHIYLGANFVAWTIYFFVPHTVTRNF